VKPRRPQIRYRAEPATRHNALERWEDEAVQQADALVVPWPRLIAVHVASTAGTDPAAVMETARAKVSEWVTANAKQIEATLRQELAPVLAAYRDLPAIVEQKPWLFEREDATQPPATAPA
jgi:hypothetical protein